MGREQLKRYFKRQTSEISHEMTWIGLRKGKLQKENYYYYYYYSLIRAFHISVSRWFFTGI